MTDFDTLCKQLEQMDSEKYAQIFADISDDVIADLTALTANGKDGVTAYMQFVLASVAADGILSKPEFTLLKPWFDKMTEKDTTYDEAVEIFNGLGLNEPEVYKEIIDTMVDIIGLVSEEIKDDIVLLCLLVCAIDGDISDKEKDWIRQLAKPLTVEVPAMDVIEEFLTKAGVFVLGTTDGDQPRMRARKLGTFWVMTKSVKCTINSVWLLLSKVPQLVAQEIHLVVPDLVLKVSVVLI